MRKNVISLVFLLAFLFLRVANVHSVSHHLDEIDTNTCELCEIITVTHQFTPFVDQSPEDIEYNLCIVPKNSSINFGYEEPLHCIVSPDFIYNKPPPSL